MESSTINGNWLVLWVNRHTCLLKVDCCRREWTEKSELTLLFSTRTYAVIHRALKSQPLRRPIAFIVHRFNLMYHSPFLHPNLPYISLYESPLMQDIYTIRFPDPNNIFIRWFWVEGGSKLLPFLGHYNWPLTTIG
jgi:hypothetical protein